MPCPVILYLWSGLYHTLPYLSRSQSKLVSTIPLLQWIQIFSFPTAFWIFVSKSLLSTTLHPAPRSPANRSRKIFLFPFFERNSSTFGENCTRFYCCSKSTKLWAIRGDESTEVLMTVSSHSSSVSIFPDQLNLPAFTHWDHTCCPQSYHDWPWCWWNWITSYLPRCFAWTLVWHFWFCFLGIKLNAGVC